MKSIDLIVRSRQLMIVIGGALLGMLDFGCASRSVMMLPDQSCDYRILNKRNMANYLPEAFRRVMEREPSTRWSISADNGSSIDVTCAWRSYSFVVSVVMDDSQFSLKYVCSQNLNYRWNRGVETIHPTYNKLVKYLAEELQDLNNGMYTDVRHKAHRFDGEKFVNMMIDEKARDPVLNEIREEKAAIRRLKSAEVGTSRAENMSVKPFVPKDEEEDVLALPKGGVRSSSEELDAIASMNINKFFAFDLEKDPSDVLRKMKIIPETEMTGALAKWNGHIEPKIGS